MEATIKELEFNIIPKSNLKLDVKFLAPDPTNEPEWPMVLINEKFGKIKVVFENGEINEFFLKAVLKRPRIKLSTTGNDSIESPNFVDFGFTNCESYKKYSIFIKNETEVESKWTINYIKFTGKKIYGHGTITKDEKEDIEKTDDPDVFQFSVSNGIIYGPSDALINVPLSYLPKVKNPNNEKYKPVKIEIMFKVKYFY